jgi:hypothetical protein
VVVSLRCAVNRTPLKPMSSPFPPLSRPYPALWSAMRRVTRRDLLSRTTPSVSLMFPGVPLSHYPTIPSSLIQHSISCVSSYPPTEAIGQLLLTRSCTLRNQGTQIDAQPEVRLAITIAPWGRWEPLQVRYHVSHLMYHKSRNQYSVTCLRCIAGRLSSTETIWAARSYIARTARRTRPDMHSHWPRTAVADQKLPTVWCLFNPSAKKGRP